MDGRACLYYKLTYEPKGSGELNLAVRRMHMLKNCYAMKYVILTYMAGF